MVQANPGSPVPRTCACCRLVRQPDMPRVIFNCAIFRTYAHSISLDGGGVRGLSSLYLLKGLMRKVNAKRRQIGKEEVLPRQLFDLIGGTSTGG